MINAFKAARLTNQTLSGVGSTLTYAGQGLVPYSGSTGNLILGNTQNISVGLVTVGYNGLGSVVSGVGNYYGIQYNMNDNSYWYNGGLYSADGSGIAINANGGVRYLYRGNSYPTVDFANMQLVNGFSNVSIDWLNKILSGAWTVNSLKLVSGATNNTVPLLFSGGYLNVNGQNLAYQVAGGYVPYAGATGTVNLNNQILTGVNSIGVNGNVMPMTNNAYSLGTPLMAWGSAYIGTLVGTGAYLNDMNAVDVNNCKLHADLPGITLDWSGKFLTGGTWQAQNLLISGSPVITAAQTGQFYAANNPLGFVTNAALSGTVVSIGGLSGVINLTGSSGVVITTGGSNLITVALNNSGQFASASAFNNTGALLQSEINQFSGIVVNTTGAFITTSMTGQFQSASQFVLTGTNIQGQLNALSGILGGTGGFVDLTSTQTIAGAKTFSNLLKATNAGGVQTPYIQGTGFYLNDMNAVDVNNCKLHADLPGITLDWSGKFLTGGTWQAQNLLISGSPVITAAQTGQFYAANNPLGFVTNAALSGTVVSIGGLSGVINLTGSSGVVITTGGSNLITVALNNSGQFASASAFNNTGALLQSEINQFSGIVVNTTGAFITTSMTGQFQSASQFVLTGTNIQGQLNALSGILGGTGGLLSVVSGQMLQSEINQFSGIVVNTTGAFDTVSARNTALSSYTLNTTFNNTGQMLQSEINQFSGMVTNTTGAFLTSSSIGSYGVSAIQPVGWGQAQGNVYIVGAGTVSITTGVTGASGWPLLIFSGATGSYVSQGQTGQFITQSMTGQFQSASQFQLTGNNIQTQFNTIYGTTGAFATSVSVAATGAAFTFFSGNQQSFSYYVPTGYDNTGVLYPVAFASAPRVLVSLEIPTNIMYMVNISNRTNTGFYAVFSDVVQESGVILHTFATLNR